uniref:Denticleless protein homolog n=2 Tax=Schistocephalus solidus TaxID=70667 RepID=A0A0X3NXG9_SCHSO
MPAFQSVFSEVTARDSFAHNRQSFSIRKCIPEIGVENFECIRSQSFQLYSNVDGTSPPFACDFSAHDPYLLLVAKEDGLVHLYNTLEKHAYALIRNYEVHDNAIFDVKWLSHARMFLTASGDQSIKLVDSASTAVVRSFLGHTMSVRSLALMPNDNHIFASASRDGCIRLWDMRSKSHSEQVGGVSVCCSSLLLPQCHVPSTVPLESPLRRLRSKSRKSLSDSHSVTCVIFGRNFDLISAGSTDGAVKIWDLRKLSSSARRPATPKMVLPYRGISRKQSGFSDLVLDSRRTRLYASCLDHTIYEYDLNSQSTRPMFVYAGHLTNSFYIKMTLSPDDRYLACGSGDHRAYIYLVGERFQNPLILSGHTGEVSVPRWSVFDPTLMVTLSDAAQLFVWRMFPSRRYTLPQSGELVGLTERLSRPTMSPSTQIDRLMPPSPQKELNQFCQSPDVAPTASPDVASPSTRKHRQVNIRSFLADISMTAPGEVDSANQNGGILDNALTSRPISLSIAGRTGGIVYGSRVVHRYPGFPNWNGPAPVALSSTPPSGCVEVDTSAPLTKSINNAATPPPSSPAAGDTPSSPQLRQAQPFTLFSDSPNSAPLTPVRRKLLESPFKDLTNSSLNPVGNLI